MFSRLNSKSIRGWIKLIAAGEPYRLLFPIGTLIGIAGVIMWPLFVWHFTETYPGHLHARVMIEGFLTAFVMGFLGTALPRLLGVPRLTIGETLGFTVVVIAVALLHFNGSTLYGDMLFILMLLGFVATLGFRALLFRQDVPPPAFVLVILGIACAAFGAVSQILEHLSPNLLPGWMPYFGRLLLYQGYLVFPIMGIGAFLLPRFFGMSSRQGFPESLSLPPGWLAKAAFAMLCGTVVMTGFVLEALGNQGWGNALRAIGIGVYFLREIPAHKSGIGGGTLALGLRLALASIPLAYLLMAIWPQHRFALIHMLMITGFSLITFIVASRVIYGHSGQTDKFRARLWPVRILVSGIVVAMLTRVSADWMPDIRMSHYAYAAIVWAASVLVWSFRIMPGVARGDSED